MVGKKLVATLAIVSALQGCDSLDLALDILEEKVTTGTRRQEVFPESSHSLRPQMRDTCIWVTALEFPDGYDWKADTLRGEVHTDIVLFLNGKRHLTIDASPTGIADPNNYCLINGNLYSFKTAAGCTSISRNGIPILTLDEEEIIRGCLQQGNDLWTLGNRVGAEGFNLRLNGQTVFRKETGRVCGHINDRQEKGVGALFENKGEITFFYREHMDGRSEWHVVRDAMDYPIPDSANLVDAYFKDGELCTLGIDPQTGVITVRGKLCSWTCGGSWWTADPSRTAFIRGHEPELLILSQGIARGLIRESILWSKSGILQEMRPGTFVVSNGRKLAMLTKDEENGFGLLVTSGELSYGYHGCYPPGQSCVVFREEDIYAAITLHSGESVLSITGIPLYHFHLNGYLTGLYIDIKNKGK